MRRIRRCWIVAGLVVAALLTSCGTRVPGQIAALHSARLGVGNSGSNSFLGATVNGASGSVPGSATTISGVGSSSSPGVGLGGNVAGGGGTTSSGGAGGASSGVGFSGASSASGAPVVVGEIGTWSGVIGGAFAPARDAFGAWVSSVNAHGGVLGHPIKLLVADDNNDASNDVSDAQAMVENDHAIALVNIFPAGGDATAIGQYAQQKNIPIIGGIPAAGPWFQSPVMFATTSDTNGTYPFGYAKVMADDGLHKVGAVYCVETTSCHTGEQAWATYARQLGLDVVYEGGISLTQPDYTAQCLQAQQAGVQALELTADANTVIRFANSCAQQGYHPLIGYGTPGVVSPVLNRDFAVVQGFPWMLTSGTPALEEYGQALARYDHNPTTGESSVGWDSGKLLQKALEISLSRSPVPSTAGLFQALWSIHNETLGGLTPSLSFNQGKPQVEPRCSYEVTVSNDQWVAPSGANPTLCAP